MFDFNWNEFRAKLMLKGYTIKQWCAENKIDIDRQRNIQQGKVSPSMEEEKLFRSVLEG